MAEESRGAAVIRALGRFGGARDQFAAKFIASDLDGDPVSHFRKRIEADGCHRQNRSAGRKKSIHSYLRFERALDDDILAKNICDRVAIFPF